MSLTPLPSTHFIGTSGWYYDDWPGRFYPEKLAKAKWLPYYSEQFNTVELNNTFYRLPRPGLMEGWRDKVTPGFRFSVKGNREITHRKKLVDVAAEVTGFYQLAALLDDKLGCVLWQLPPSLARNDELLTDFCQTLSRDFRNVIEFRHPSWFAEPVYELLRQYQIACCALSTPNLPATAIATADWFYLRLHGLGPELYKYRYSEAEMQYWTNQLQNVAATSYWVYFNNTFYADGAENAREFGNLVHSN